MSGQFSFSVIVGRFVTSPIFYFLILKIKTMSKFKNTFDAIKQASPSISENEIDLMLSSVEIVLNKIPNADSIDDFESSNCITREEYKKQMNWCYDLFHSMIYNIQSLYGNKVSEIISEYFFSDEDGMVKVGVYEASREYGGGEEGGWYYTNYYHVETKRMPFNRVDNFKVQLANENEEEGRKYEYQGMRVAYVELYEGQHTKDGTEHYC